MPLQGLNAENSSAVPAATLLRFRLTFVFKRALLLPHTSNNNAHREPYIVLLLLAQKLKRCGSL
jgi:hypothetical protein